MIKYDKKYSGFFSEAEEKGIKKYCEKHGFKVSGFIRWVVKKELNGGTSSE